MKKYEFTGDTKACSKCGVVYINSYDYFGKNGNGGLRASCKKCSNEQSRRYRRTESGKLVVKRCKKESHWRPSYDKIKEYRAKNKEKHTARKILQRCVKLKYLIRKECYICGEHRTEAHHLDYSFPLEVVWLCRSCHRRHHEKSLNRIEKMKSDLKKYPLEKI